MTYVFIGGTAEAPNIKLTRFGQRVELPPDLAAETAHDGGLICIPAELFDPLMAEFKIDEAGLKKYGLAAMHGNAPKAAGPDFQANFNALVKRSREALHDIREPLREEFRQARTAVIEAAALATQPKETE